MDWKDLPQNSPNNKSPNIPETLMEQATRFKLQTSEFTCETMVRALPKIHRTHPHRQILRKTIGKINNQKKTSQT